jgi:HSP20 family protein
MLPNIWQIDPFRELMRLRNEMNRLFSGFSYPFEEVYPLVNIWMNEEGAIVTAELPGINMDKLDISILNDTVTISGSREDEEKKVEDNYHRKERMVGKFSRTLQLPFKINGDKVEARYERGILKLILPREEAEKPKKITIKSN